MKEYRTIEQFEEICSSAINGNWSQAFQECVEHCFYANDLIKAFEDNEFCGIGATDIALLAEGASDLRYKTLK